MALLTTISTLLDIKLVQWALLGLCVLLLGILLFGSLKMSTLKMEYAYLQIEAARLGEGLMLQNNKIKELHEIAKVYNENFLKKKEEAKRLSVENAKILDTISRFKFSGNCSNDLHTAISLIKTKKDK